MAIKTISLELDAYEKLRQAKRGKESFSDVVRRAHFEPEESTGAYILKETLAMYKAGNGVTKSTVDYWDTLEEEAPRISDSPWDEE